MKNAVTAIILHTHTNKQTNKQRYTLGNNFLRFTPLEIQNKINNLRSPKGDLSLTGFKRGVKIETNQRFDLEIREKR